MGCPLESGCLQHHMAQLKNMFVSDVDSTDSDATQTSEVRMQLENWSRAVRLWKEMASAGVLSQIATSREYERTVLALKGHMGNGMECAIRGDTGGA